MADAGTYDVVLTNSLGTTTSTGAVLSVQEAAPTITAQPLAQQRYTGQILALSVTVNGSLPLSYRWMKDGTTITGATTATYSLANLALSDAGKYSVVVSNAFGQATSAEAEVTVEVPMYHSADSSRDWRIGVSELVRMIQLYNTRNGTSRTGCYQVAGGTADGFAPDTARLGTDVVTLDCWHSADSNKDGKISVGELTRMIQLYNTREGTSRSGTYHRQRPGDPAHADGFAPGA